MNRDTLMERGPAGRPHGIFLGSYVNNILHSSETSRPIPIFPRFRHGSVPFSPRLSSNSVFFLFLRKKQLDFFFRAVYGIAILRQTAQRDGSSDPLRSAVRDCLGYTVRSMRRLFSMKPSSAGRSSAFVCAVLHRNEFQTASPKRFVPPDLPSGITAKGQKQ